MALLAAAGVAVWPGGAGAGGADAEKAAAQALRELETCVTKQDFVRAYLTVKKLQGRFRETEAARGAATRVREVAERVVARLAARKAADDRRYGIVPPSKVGWREALDLAFETLGRESLMKGRVRSVAVVRVVGEDPQAEATFRAVCANSLAEIAHAGAARRDREVGHGGFVLLVPVATKRKTWAFLRGKVTKVALAGVEHFPESRVFTFAEGEVVPLGDVVLKVVPRWEKGRVVVTPRFEAGARLVKERLRLRTAAGALVDLGPIEDGRRWSSRFIPRGRYTVLLEPDERVVAVPATVQVEAGTTARAALFVSWQRDVELAWWFRRSVGADTSWQKGSDRLRVGRFWQPRAEWKFPSDLFVLTAWDGETCKLRTTTLMPLRLEPVAPDDSRFGYPIWRMFSGKIDTLPIEDGAVFALQHRTDTAAELVIRIRRIKPVGRPYPYTTP